MLQFFAYFFVFVSLSACVSNPEVNSKGNYSEPIGYSRVTDNPTIYSKALQCLGNKIDKQKELSLAVGTVHDLTNTKSLSEGGMVTAGASLMVMSALSKAKIKLVERINMQVAKDEMRYAMDKILGNPKEDGYKALHAGRVKSSDYYITGGITELNFNIQTNKGELKIPEIGFGKRYAVMNIAIDMRLVSTETLEIENIVSLQKQIIGKEKKAGFFDFIGSSFTVALYNNKQTEPIQLGVRTIIERAVIDLITPLYQLDPSSCIEQVELIHGN